ncbi:Defensin-like protein 5 [Cardamine amara subsp. amara]|uniref:Defensin-like protein 5 n=1 Tax=Cardamine amara subsp. amara TaxID=228776 RepID=A0ABD1CA81_CARAN
MKLSPCSFLTVPLLFMLLVATGMGPVTVEARTCQSSSQLFSGPCLSTSNCANVCHNEGFTDGDCRGFRRRCFCNKPC